jgi:hypothetical protein
VPVRLADLLDVARTAAPSIGDGSGLVAELRAELEAVAAAVTEGVGPDGLPIRAPKDRIAKVLACEQLAMAPVEHGELNEPVVRGRILDRLLHHHVHGAGAVGGPALAIAEGALDAERDDDTVAWLQDRLEERVRLAEDATDFAARLADLGPIDPSWWPRCEDRVRVDLAGGRVVCSAQLDLVAGGHPTGLPMVIVEAKSGRFSQEHREGLFWYALLAALRHGTPPASVIGWSAWDGSGWAQAVTEGMLRGATQRSIAALERLGELARGRTPARTACRGCTWCPERATCDAAATSEDGDDDW